MLRLTLGDPPVSWVVEAGGRRILHGGDTMFRGFWWGIRQFVGPVDVALLPVNRPVFEGVPGHSPSSPFPAVLLPEQAVAAARILGARIAIPIHYGLDRPPLSAQTPEAIAPIVLEPGDDTSV